MSFEIPTEATIDDIITRKIKYLDAGYILKIQKII